MKMKIKREKSEQNIIEKIKEITKSKWNEEVSSLM